MCYGADAVHFDNCAECNDANYERAREWLYGIGELTLVIPRN